MGERQTTHISQKPFSRPSRAFALPASRLGKVSSVGAKANPDKKLQGPAWPTELANRLNDNGLKGTFPSNKDEVFAKFSLWGDFT